MALWHGPDPVLAWARVSVCVFPQDQHDPLWIPERLSRRCNKQDEASVIDPAADLDNSLANPGQGTILWAIAKVWPIPLPVHTVSKVLPVFFSTSCELGLPCVNLDPDTAQYSATNISLHGALCFSLINNSNPCIWMKNGLIGSWIDPLGNSQFQNLTIRLLNVSGTRDEKGPSLKNLSIHKTLDNFTVPASPVCLNSPFFFLLSNATNAIKEVILCNLTNVSCIAIQCLNGSANTAVVMRIPMYVPIPVKVDTGTFPITEIIRTKWDFGITTAMVTAITLSAAAAMTAAVAMAAQVQ
ncbi:hypothetical protein [Geopseudomonas aromaticivorans]|uniref:hypothetical protein n=1 Tax=Geopseudomonas aromaticivorans TaxID=2849492 RepID=UPI0020C8C7B8|nr:hypothetical protein [Pseudomonas aromaticivorans]